MTGQNKRFMQDVAGRLLCAWGAACGAYGMSIPEPHVVVFLFPFAVACVSAVIIPYVLSLVVLWISGAMIVLAMLIGVGLAGVQGLASMVVLSMVVFVPSMIGAAMLKAIHAPRPLPSGICAACGYSLAGLASNRCPECGETVLPVNPHVDSGSRSENTPATDDRAG